MNKTIVQSLVKMELQKYNLKDWNFQWNNAKTISGQCFYTSKIIKLSMNYVELNSFELVYNTILHEIAHALNYIRNHEVGHGQSWHKIALSIGCNGERRTTKAIASKPKHIYYCEGCQKEFGRYKKIKNIKFVWHKKCGRIKGRLIKIK